MGYKLKDIIQELQKYNFEYETNITGIEKIDNKIIISTEIVKIPEVNNDRTGKAKQFND
jgi:hypothetical protein